MIHEYVVVQKHEAVKVQIHEAVKVQIHEDVVHGYVAGIWSNKRCYLTFPGIWSLKEFAIVPHVTQCTLPAFEDESKCNNRGSVHCPKNNPHKNHACNRL